MTRKLFAATALAGATIALAACDTAPSDGGEVNLYSSRHYDTDLALYEDFTEQTGIEVNLVEADADQLIERIQSEGEFTEADLLITVDAGRLWRAEEAGVLAPTQSDVLAERLPDHLRHPDGLWFGLSTRARVIIYNKEAGVPEGLDDYADLADPAWRGAVCIRSSSNIYNISLMSSIIANDGPEAAEEWARGVVANFAREPQGNDTAQIEAVASGECRIGLVNTYYLAREERAEDLAKIGVIFPNSDGRGTHVNVSGAGVVANAPNRENAIAFLEYLTSESAQRYFADGNNEYPAVTGMAGNSAVEALGEYSADTLNASRIGEGQNEAVQIFDRAGWN